MDLDAAFATLQAATASVVAALREGDLTALTRDQLVSVMEATQRGSNTLGGVQTVAVAHLAAIEDTVDQHGVWGEQHRGLGHLSLDTPGMIAPVLGITAQAATARVEVAVHQVKSTPRLVEAMLEGDLDPWRARVVTTEVEMCPDDESADDDSPGEESRGDEKSADTGGPGGVDGDEGGSDDTDDETGDDATRHDAPGHDDSSHADTGHDDSGRDNASGDQRRRRGHRRGSAEDIIDDLLDHYAGCGRGWFETTGPLRGRVRRMVARAHPDLVEEEAAAAREGRSLRRSPATLGTDHWEADLPVEVSLPMWQAVEALAHKLKNADPDLKIGQARADALAQLVLQQAEITVHLHGTVPSEASDRAGAQSGGQASAQPSDRASAQSGGQASGQTGGQAGAQTSDPAAARSSAAAARSTSSNSAEPSDARAASMSAEGVPARLTEVGGLGSTQPTLLDLDRLAMAHGVRVVPSTSLTCDSATGALIAGIVPASLARLARKNAARRSDGYVVPADMARLVRLRDGRCRFPNCVIPASKTDQDHVIPWPVGETTPINLMCLCRRHHRVKQRRGWTARLDPDGAVHWSDPTGHTTITYPIDHLDRATLPLRDRGDGSRASAMTDETFQPPTAAEPTSADTHATFREIVHHQLRDLEDLPTALEDHLWRQLELALAGSHPPEPLTVRWVPRLPDQPPF